MSEMVKGLLITAIGMGLVFVVIIMLWGMMALLVKLTSGKQVAKSPVEIPAEPAVATPLAVGAAGLKQKAAAVAVAYMLGAGSVRRVASGATINEDSNWQAQGRARQMNEHSLRGQHR